MIYLDNAATTFPKPECVYSALDEANRTSAFNAGRGSYKESSNAAKMIDSTREKVAAIVGTPAESVAFASSATEALNQIIYGIPWNRGDVVFVSPFEHNATVRPLNVVAKEKDIEIVLIPFNKDDWTLDLDGYKNLLAIKHPKAVFLSQISNVTGYLLPYETIFEHSAKLGSVNVLDASQGFGVVPIRNTENINFIVFAGHKSLYASFGVGGFIACKKDILSVVKAGGTGSDSLNLDMEDSGPNRYEAGSHNIVAIAGLDASIDWLKIEGEGIEQKEKQLTLYLITRLNALPNVKVYVPCPERVLGIVSLSVAGYSPEDVGTILYDEYQIAVRTGYHCAPFVHEFLSSKETQGTVRISLGAFNTKRDIDILIEALVSLQ